MFTEDDIVGPLNTDLTLPQYNAFIIRGRKIYKFTYDQVVWSARGAFEVAEDGYLDHSVADDGYWPDEDDYGTYWAKYGEAEEWEVPQPDPPAPDIFADIIAADVVRR